MQPAIKVEGLTKTYKSGFQALKSIDLEVQRGEIFALLGPNGAGKTTLMGIICGIVRPTAGRVLVDGADVVTNYRATRTKIGLVPQELTVDTFQRVTDTVAYSRGLFGKPRDDARVEKVLRDLSLWDKRHAPVGALSGGMKRRVLIAKALSGGHVPVGAVIAKKSVFAKVFSRMDKAVVHGSTFAKNDMAMAAGLATLELIEREDLVANAAAKGER